jgi:hypothetical protein
MNCTICNAIISANRSNMFVSNNELVCESCYAEATALKGDNINHPAHYTTGKIETIDYIEDMGYIEGNIIKYISRYKYKNGLEDVKKARWYVNRLISKLEAE